MEWLQQVLASALLAFFSWLIKDILIALYLERTRAIRNEWEYRLKEVFSPLYFWSGVALFEHRRGACPPLDLRHLEERLEKAAYIIPQKHYYTLVQIVQSAQGQKTTAAATSSYLALRDYLISQIELLNFLLYRNPSFLDINSYAQTLYGYRFAVRMIAAMLIHFFIWAAIAALLLLLYLSYLSSTFWPFILVGLMLLSLVVFEMRKRMETSREISKRLGSG